MHTEKISKMGLLLALGMILSYVESLFPIAPAVPGIKIGLANILAVLLLYSYGVGACILYQGMRIFLTALLFGSFYSGIYSLAGAALSLAAMILLKKAKLLDIEGVSMSGGVFHNIGQLLIAFLFVQNTAIFGYLPILLIAGALSGYLIGLVGEILIKRRLL